MLLPATTRVIYMLALRGDPGKDTRLRCCVPGGEWSDGWDIASAGAAPQTAVLLGPAPAGGAPAPGFEVVVAVEGAPAPFSRTKVVTVRPRIVLVNATAQKLFWRQGFVKDEAGVDAFVSAAAYAPTASVRAAPGSGDGGSPAATMPDAEIAPYSCAPLWWPVGAPSAEDARKAAEAAAGRGGVGGMFRRGANAARL